MNMKVAVFGASGFVGINVVDSLARNNIDVIASDVRETSFEHAGFMKADLLDYNQVERVVRDTDVVIHLAASPLPVSIEKPKLNAQINIVGSLNILDAARACGVKKVVFSSASSIVGDVKYNPVDELHPCTPKTPYGVAKYAMEHYLRVYHELYNLDYLVFRFFNVYGPWQYPESRAVIPMVYDKLNKEGSFNVFGDGSQTRDFIYVGDIAEFFAKAAKNPVKNEVVNMGTGKSTTIKEIVEISGKILDIDATINYLPARPGEIGNFVADTKKLQSLFGSVPSTDLSAGLRMTFDWLKEHS
jgi:UDP-glucose 4-epimerase